MNANQLANMMLFVFGFLLIWAAMRMGWVLVRPQVSRLSPMVTEATDFVLL